MADLTIGEVGKVLQLNLVNVDQTVNPNVQNPLDLTSATSVQIKWLICDQGSVPLAPSATKTMTIVGSPVNGIVNYTFLAGDLVAPLGMGKDGVFRYTVVVNFPAGGVLYPVIDGKLTIKNDAVL